MLNYFFQVIRLGITVEFFFNILADFLWFEKTEKKNYHLKYFSQSGPYFFILNNFLLFFITYHDRVVKRTDLIDRLLNSMTFCCLKHLVFFFSCLIIFNKVYCHRQMFYEFWCEKQSHYHATTVFSIIIFSINRFFLYR